MFGNKFERISKRFRKSQRGKSQSKNSEAKEKIQEKNSRIPSTLSSHQTQNTSSKNFFEILRIENMRE